MQRKAFIAFMTVITIALVLSGMPRYKWMATYVKNILHNKLNTSNEELLNNVSFQCTEAFKRRHYIFLDLNSGRTGNTVFKVCCLLAISARNCYTPMIDRENKRFLRTFKPFFDLRNVEMPEQKIDKSTFRALPTEFASQRRKIGIGDQYNWTLKSRCSGNSYIEDQEQFVRSSIRLKRRYLLEADKYISKFFSKRSTVAIHVRRTDRINFDSYKFSGFEWYKSFIEKAMKYLKADYKDLSFIFVSDDIAWCKENFHGPHIHFSPGTSVGFDLALLAICDHVILTVGTFGRNGAWLGEHKSVIYSKYFGIPRFYRDNFFLKSWTGI